MPSKGKFRPKNPSKYAGDPTNIIYRSSWEKKFMRYLDEHPKVMRWSSEEFFIPYFSPVDPPSRMKPRRYFPDFYVRKRDKSGKDSVVIIEVKPKSQTLPPKKPKQLTEGYLRREQAYSVNMAKWKAAEKFCAKRRWKFILITEDELNIKYG